jgi:hypothetical protein
MKRNEVLGGKYLNSDDVRLKDLNVTIEGVEMEEFKAEDGYKQKKMVLSFRGLEKKLACGKEKVSLLFEMFGEDSDTEDWVGQRIRIFLGKTNYAGKRVDCTSIGAPKAAAPSKGRPVAAVVDNEDNEDPDASSPF